MKRSALSLLMALQMVLLVAVGMPGQTQGPPKLTAPSFQPPVRDSLLNGLQLVVVDRPATNNVAINLTVRSGSMFDVIEKGGLAEMVSDLLLTGGTAGWAPTRIAQTIDSAGPDFKITTNWDATTFTATTKAEDVPVILDLIGNLIGQAKFDRGALEKAKTDRIARMQAASESPAETAESVLAAKLYPRYPLGHTILGTAQSISNIGLSDVLSFYKRFYLANNMALVVVGNARREDITSAARSSLGQLLKGEIVPSAFTPAPPPQKTSIYLVDKPTGDESFLAMGHTGIARTNDNFFAAQVLNYALGGNPGSRLTKKLTEEHPYARIVASRFDALRLPGPFIVSAKTSTKTLADAATEMVKVLTDVQAQGLTAAEIENAKDHFISTYDLKLETNAQFAERLAEIESYGLGRDYILTYKTRMAAVTQDQVRNANNTLLKPDAMIIVAVGPAAQIKEGLEKLGPVEMVTYDPKVVVQPPKPEVKPTVPVKPTSKP